MTSPYAVVCQERTDVWSVDSQDWDERDMDASEAVWSARSLLSELNGRMLLWVGSNTPCVKMEDVGGHQREQDGEGLSWHVCFSSLRRFSNAGAAATERRAGLPR